MKAKAVLCLLVCIIFGYCNTSLCEAAYGEEPVIFEENDLWGVKDNEGNVIVPPIYNEIAGFSRGYSRVETDDGTGLIDISGKLIVPCVFDSVTIPEDGFFTVCYVDYENDYNEYYEIYRESGIATGWRFDFANGFHNGYACVILNGDEYLLDTGGNLHSISPYRFAHGWGFSEGRLLVKKDELYGYLDETLQLVIPCIYTDADADFYNGVSHVWIGDERYRIDLYGNYIDIFGIIIQSPSLDDKSE